MVIRVAFYKGKGKFIDKLIKWWTKSPYSHCELMFPDDRMFSSDAWSGGVRYNKNYNLANWDIVETPITQIELRSLIEWCDWKNGSAYDWWGTLSFILPFVHESKKKWFCSELCAAGLIWISKLPSTTKISNLDPGELYKLLGEVFSGQSNA
jgi:hypothetical protein